MAKDPLGNRIKKYESIFKQTAVPRMPLMIRVDGRAFHSLMKKRPAFDIEFMTAMRNAAVYVASCMQGFKVGYIQSDEVTFCLTDYDTLQTEGWFGYEIPKIVSISAALMSVSFNKEYSHILGNTSFPRPIFDSRAFNIPIEDVPNAFLWRARDWKRNSINMYARQFFTTVQLHKKRQSAVHEMLHKIGKNWTTELSNAAKNGTFLIRDPMIYKIIYVDDVLPTYKSVSNLVEPILAIPNE